MAARALWTGTISFGLVSVPVRLFPALRQHRLELHLVHEPDGGPIGYQKFCKLEGEPVPDDEIVKALEVGDSLVYFTDEDFEAAQAERTRTIDVSDFVAVEEIDPVYYERTYYAGPGPGGEKPYALLVAALRESGLVGVGTVVLRDRQHPVVLRPRDRLLLVEQLHFADEIRESDGIASEGQRVGKREKDMALELIEHFRSSFEPERYRDTYREQLLALAKAKERGDEVHEAPEPAEEEEPVDLMEALRASVEQAKRGRRSTRSGRSSERRPARRGEKSRRAARRR
jgi:DNA end-binding protein Ku